jgi:hypothetical protein
VTFTESERAVIERFLDDERVQSVLAEAVAQGMHSPFSLNCDYWGRQCSERLVELLDQVTVVETSELDLADFEDQGRNN